jgi:hypothetical protein
MVLTGSLDLFTLLVEFTFGSIFLAILGVAIILFITGVMGRLSMETIMIIIITYLAMMMVGYLGAIPAVLLLLWALWYCISGIVNSWNAIR